MTTGPRLILTVVWYWNRLTCMSPAEIGHRLGEMLVSQVQRIGLVKLGVTPHADLSISVSDFIGATPGVTPRPYIDAADEILHGRQRVFALVGEPDAVPQWNRDPKTGTMAPLDFARTLDYSNEALVGDIKYLWEPNRHIHLVTLAQAYQLTGERRYIDGLRVQVESWIEQCPYLKGPNWSSALEVAIRLINWSIAWQLVGGPKSVVFSGEEGKRFRDRWLGAIYLHMHFVRGNFSRFSSANNHLIGEAAGLIVGATTWPYWRESQDWVSEAQDILEREVLLQIAPDGVNREQAVWYQQFVLDFLLVAALAGRANGRDFSSKYWKRIEVMLEFLTSIMDVGGHVPMVGDADDGYVTRLSQEKHFCPFRSLLATGAVLFRRSDFKAKAGTLDDKTRWLLGNRTAKLFSAIPVTTVALPGRQEFRDGGYYVLGSGFETTREIRLIADTGSLGYLSIAAHGHADALAFTLSVAGREFLIDPGTYVYHKNRTWRDFFRGTAAHNTVMVDGKNQSESGGSFMWLRKARAMCELWETGPESDRLIGSHDGYRRLVDPVVHRREIAFEKLHRRIVVTDTLDCVGQHSAECRWHFSEACEVWVTDNVLYARNGSVVIKLRQADKTLKIDLHRGEEDPPCGWVSRRYDVKVPAVTAVVQFAVQGNTTLITEIFCGDSSAESAAAPDDIALASDTLGNR